MPQNPTQVLAGKNPSNTPAPLNTDATGTLAVAKTPAGVAAVPKLDLAGSLVSNTIPPLASLGITAAAVIKAAAGRVGAVNVIVGGSTPGAIHNCLTTAAASATNQICAIPPLTTAQISTIPINMTCVTGIVAIPGTGQTLAVSYE